MIKKIKTLFQTVFSLLAILAFSSVEADAAATAWHDLGGAKARLVAIESSQGNTISGIVEIVLKEGWKTYWRNPGTGGIPPKFNFTRSSGVAVGEVLYPAPHRLSTQGVINAGYKHRVAFPFLAQLINHGESKPVEGKLALDIFIGLCEAICIPATASFNLPLGDLAASNPTDKTLIETAHNALPKTEEFAATVAPLKNPSNGNHIMGLEVSIPLGLSQILSDAKTVEIFVEDGHASYFEATKLKHIIEPRDPNFITALFEVPYELANERLKLANSTLTLTLRVDDQSFQTVLKPATTK